ncbi:ribonuclease H2 subunit B isoform X2 [Benincasa hispida]|uniref:ribonuclease H2 subunit B isoform X2 n=1 Tax=Benincasa hispida TaxID=102211 RepID=UPI0019018F3B|nr:ribonuclease H2 subunit B isoform X2 [Benincasa hispida]
MAWWEGVEETRILIAPDHGVKENGTGFLLSLRHPKSGNTTCFLYVNEMLEEIHWFKQSYSSWFLGDYVTEDGRLYSATPVDPVFIFLPIFAEARMKGDDPGKFRQLDDIMFVNGYPGYLHLLSLAEKSMQVVCEVKEVGSSRFFRLDDSKVLAWLYHKVCQLKKTLCTLDKNYAAREEKDTLSDPVSILGEYLKDKPWLEPLCDHLKLNFAEATRKASDSEKPPSSIENNFDSISQDKCRSGAKNTRNGKQGKKPKVETESRNIKDMFSKAIKSKR